MKYLCVVFMVSGCLLESRALGIRAIPDGNHVCSADTGIQPRFSFSYDGASIDSAKAGKVRTYMDDEWTCDEYAFPKGLKVITRSRRFGDAVEWVNVLENIGSEKTGRITLLKDCDIVHTFDPDSFHASGAYQQDLEGLLVFSHRGSTQSEDEFAANVTSFEPSNLRCAALPQKHGNASLKHFAPVGGRSSDGVMPFFNLNRGMRGLIVAVGWSGQWNCDFARLDDGSVRVTSGLEDCDFHLFPGEHFRTTSIVLLPYASGYIASQNAFRRLVKERYSIIGQPGRPGHGPSCINFWGGLRSDEIIKRIDLAGREKLGFEFVWVDAGWYGGAENFSSSAYGGTWWQDAGDWRVNKYLHPNGLNDVVAAVKRNGMEFLLWFEIERAQPSSLIAKEHPEYLFGNLLDLGNPDAWNWAHTTLSNYIARLDIRCYRVDFNMSPLGNWRKADLLGRKGVHEAKYITGLYRLWDTLLAEFPHLIIDTCASGGRRIDIETVRRSIPLLRSDYQCSANNDPDVAQNHTLGLARWLPYHGTGIGRIVGDTYRIRSCYSTSMANSFLSSLESDPARLSASDFDWLRRINAEYKHVRTLMEGDYYPLVEMTFKVDKSAWCAYQFDDSASKAGCVLAFRRAASPYHEAKFALGGIVAAKFYVFADADTGEETVFAGADLAKNGFRAVIPERRASKIWFYSIQ